MDKFKQLHKDLDELKTSDQKAKTNIINLKKYIDNQEQYYNSIPAGIRTTNTLNMIIQRLSSKVDQVRKFVNGDDEGYKAMLEAAYVEQRRLKEACEEEHTITYAFLQKSDATVIEHQVAANKVAAERVAEQAIAQQSIQELNNTKKKLEEDESKIKLQEAILLKNKEKIDEEEKTIEDLKNNLTRQVGEVTKLNKDIEENGNKMKTLQENLANEVASKNTLDTKVKELSANNETNSEEIISLKKTIAEHEETIKNRNIEIDASGLYNNELKEEVNRLNKQIKTNGQELTKASQSLEDKTKELDSQQQELISAKQALDYKIEKLKNIVLEKTQNENKLKLENVKLNDNILDLQKQLKIQADKNTLPEIKNDRDVNIKGYPAYTNAISELNTLTNKYDNSTQKETDGQEVLDELKKLSNNVKESSPTYLKLFNENSSELRNKILNENPSVSGGEYHIDYMKEKLYSDHKILQDKLDDCAPGKRYLLESELHEVEAKLSNLENGGNDLLQHSNSVFVNKKSHKKEEASSCSMM